MIHPPKIHGFRSRVPARLYPLIVTLLGVVLAFWIALGETPQDPPGMSFARWFAACKDLPSNRDRPLKYPPRAVLPLPQYKEFAEVVDDFFAHCQNGPLAEEALWLGATRPEDTFYTANVAGDTKLRFQPFAQRLKVPPGSEVILHGDLHGDILSLVRGIKELNERGYLDGFKIVKPDTYMVFLGDYTDRGMYGVEVIYTILRLKLANPERVWLVRGNHEDLKVITKYGFVHEGVYKYGNAFDYRRIARLYDFLPVVLYLGCEESYVQCNHGGMEPGYDGSSLLAAGPKVSFDLLGELKRADFLKAHPTFADQLPKNDDTRQFFHLLYQNFTLRSPTSPDYLGFLWGDFTLQAHEPLLRWDDDRPGWMHGKAGTKILLNDLSDKGPRVHAVIRAHQHSRELNPMMRRLIASHGVFEHWQEADVEALLDAEIPELEKRLNRQKNRSLTEGTIYTLNVSPDSVYGLRCDYDFDTFAIVHVAEAFEDWRLEVINVTES